MGGTSSVPYYNNNNNKNKNNNNDTHYNTCGILQSSNLVSVKSAFLINPLAILFAIQYGNSETTRFYCRTTGYAEFKMVEF